jgi:hypothetical protein
MLGLKQLLDTEWEFWELNKEQLLMIKLSTTFFYLQTYIESYWFQNKYDSVTHI